MNENPSAMLYRQVRTQQLQYIVTLKWDKPSLEHLWGVSRAPTSSDRTAGYGMLLRYITHTSDCFNVWLRQITMKHLLFLSGFSVKSKGGGGTQVCAVSNNVMWLFVSNNSTSLSVLYPLNDSNLARTTHHFYPLSYIWCFGTSKKQACLITADINNHSFTSFSYALFYYL